jgi:hypothetical protein
MYKNYEKTNMASDDDSSVRRAAALHTAPRRRPVAILRSPDPSFALLSPSDSLRSRQSPADSLRALKRTSDPSRALQSLSELSPAPTDSSRCIRAAAAPDELAARLGADYESAWPLLPCASRSPRAPASTSDLLRAPARTSKPPTPALASIPRLGFRPGGGFDFDFDLFEPAPSCGAPNAPGACSELFEGE